MKWEYLREIADENYLTLPYLNELGANGWELVSVDNGIAYFKRAIESDTGMSEEVFNAKVLEAIRRLMK